MTERFLQVFAATEHAVADDGGCAARRGEVTAAGDFTGEAAGDSAGAEREVDRGSLRSAGGREVEEAGPMVGAYQFEPSDEFHFPGGRHSGRLRASEGDGSDAE